MKILLLLLILSPSLALGASSGDVIVYDPGGHPVALDEANSPLATKEYVEDNTIDNTYVDNILTTEGFKKNPANNTWYTDDTFTTLADTAIPVNAYTATAQGKTRLVWGEGVYTISTIAYMIESNIEYVGSAGTVIKFSDGLAPTTLSFFNSETSVESHFSIHGFYLDGNIVNNIESCTVGGDASCLDGVPCLCTDHYSGIILNYDTDFKIYDNEITGMTWAPGD